MADMLRRQPGLVEYEPCAAAHLFQFEAHDAVDALRHAFDAPRLHDPLAGPELDVDAADIAIVSGERAADLAADLGLAVAGERFVLLRHHESAVDALRRGLDGDFLMDRGGHGDCLCLSMTRPAQLHLLTVPLPAGARRGAPSAYAARRSRCLPWKCGATSRMKRSISSLTIWCGFMPTLK